MLGIANNRIDEIIDEFRSTVQDSFAGWQDARNPEGFREMELEIAAVTRKLGDRITEVVFRSMLSDTAFQVEASLAARKALRLRQGDRRPVTIKLLGGSEIRLENLEYLKPNHRNRPGQKRKKRGKKGVGLYPILAVLGVNFGVTPALAAEISRQVADSDSVRAGRAALARRGIDLGHKKTLDIVNSFAHRAVEQRLKWLEEARAKAPSSGLLKGRRVVVSTDGGRMRERVNKRGRRRANGHHGFNAPWREPKLLLIYVIDNKGKLVNEFRPVCDGTMDDCEAVFDMLVGYLKALGAHEAKQLIIVADGAKWIWERTNGLVKQIGIDPEKVFEVVDFYHAAEKLNTIGDIPAKWSKKRKKEWVAIAKNLLYAGKIDQLVNFIDQLATGRRSKKVRSHLGYFVRNSERMQYKKFIKMKIPIGSGAMESAIRRVINLRLKSNAKFWREENGQGMLLIRSYLKSWRFDDLVTWSICCAASWWFQFNDVELPTLIANGSRPL